MRSKNSGPISSASSTTRTSRSPALRLQVSKARLEGPRENDLGVVIPSPERSEGEESRSGYFEGGRSCPSLDGHPGSMKCHSDPEHSEGEESRSAAEDRTQKTRARFLASLGMTVHFIAVRDSSSPAAPPKITPCTSFLRSLSSAKAGERESIAVGTGSPLSRGRRC